MAVYYTRFNSVDTRNCISMLEKHVHALNNACVHNNDITKIIGLQHVPGNVGRLTHFLLKRKTHEIYKYSTLMYSEEGTRQSVEESAYFARYFLNMIGQSVIEYVFSNPGVCQSEISEKCFGLTAEDYHDKHWIASQILSVLGHFGILTKYANGYRKGTRTSVKPLMRTALESYTQLNDKVFKFGFENVRDYIHNKRIGSMSEQWYVRHLLRDPTAWAITRMEVQKTFPGLIGVGGKPLRFDLYIEQDHNVLKCIEIDEASHETNNKKTVEHDQRKLDFTENHNVTLVRMSVN
jgi:hypothetical protein